MPLPTTALPSLTVKMTTKTSITTTVKMPPSTTVRTPSATTVKTPSSTTVKTPSITTTADEKNTSLKLTSASSDISGYCPNKTCKPPGII